MLLCIMDNNDALMKVQQREQFAKPNAGAGKQFFDLPIEIRELVWLGNQYTLPVPSADRRLGLHTVSNGGMD